MTIPVDSASPESLLEQIAALQAALTYHPLEQGFPPKSSNRTGCSDVVVMAIQQFPDDPLRAHFIDYGAGYYDHLNQHWYIALGRQLETPFRVVAWLPIPLFSLST